jgi:hypothetical protein
MNTLKAADMLRGFSRERENEKLLSAYVQDVQLVQLATIRDRLARPARVAQPIPLTDRDHNVVQVF